MQIKMKNWGDKNEEKQKNVGQVNKKGPGYNKRNRSNK